MFVQFNLKITNLSNFSGKKERKRASSVKKYT